MNCLLKLRLCINDVVYVVKIFFIAIPLFTQMNITICIGQTNSYYLSKLRIIKLHREDLIIPSNYNNTTYFGTRAPVLRPSDEDNALSYVSENHQYRIVV